MLDTTWKTTLAGGDTVGGVLLERFSGGMFAPALLVSLAATPVVV